MGLYEDHACQKETLAAIPPQVLDALRERGHSDDDIWHMSAERIFKEFLEWEGIIGYDILIWDVVLKLRHFSGEDYK